MGGTVLGVVTGVTAGTSCLPGTSCPDYDSKSNRSDYVDYVQHPAPAIVCFAMASVNYYRNAYKGKHSFPNPRQISKEYSGQRP